MLKESNKKESLGWQYKEFNFDLDPCATHENAKCDKYFTVIENGLKQDWGDIKYFATLHTVEL